MISDVTNKTSRITDIINRTPQQRLKKNEILTTQYKKIVSAYTIMITELHIKWRHDRGELLINIWEKSGVKLH